AEAILEHARSSAAVTMAQDHVLSLEGRVAIGDANAQALDRLNAAQMVQRNTQRELDRANAPIVMALQHRDSMVNELENLQTKQISILEDGIAQAQVGLDPG